MKRKKILIVEDDLDLVKGLRKRLRANFYDVSYALDGVSAIKKANQEKPDLIILDINLPGGDGFVVMDRLEESDYLSTTPIIIITARDPSTSFEKSIKAGVAAYFHKPLDDEQLLSVVKTVLGDS